MSDIAQKTEIQTAPEIPKPGKRIHFIDAIRGLAALYVVLCHSYYEPTNGFYAQHFMSHLMLTYGQTAVDVFIVISGYCLMLPVAKRQGELGSISTFFKHRALRILPPYFAALILCSIYILLFASKNTGTVWDNSLPLNIKVLTAHILMLQDIPFFKKQGGAIDYVSWSIAVEWQIYFLMPLIVFALRRYNEVLVAIISCAVGLGIQFGTKGYFFEACPWFIGLFVFGCISARHSITAPGRFVPRLRVISSLLILGVIGIIFVKGHSFYIDHEPEIDIVIGAVTAMSLYCLYSDKDSRQHFSSRILSYAPLVALGEFSYSLYLVHPPVLHFLDRILWSLFHLQSVPMFFSLLLCLPIVIAVAYGFHIVFERPFMRRKPAAAPVVIEHLQTSNVVLLD